MSKRTGLVLVADQSNKAPRRSGSRPGPAQEVLPKQDQSNETPAEQDHRTEQTVLVMLLTGGRRIWSLDELVAEIGRRMETVDALAALQAAGLVHRCNEFVFATRAAVGSREQVGASDCLSTDARRRADATGRKAAAPASAARSRAVRTTGSLSLAACGRHGEAMRACRRKAREIFAR